jgi:hypothetical protein
MADRAMDAKGSSTARQGAHLAASSSARATPRRRKPGSTHSPRTPTAARLLALDASGLGCCPEGLHAAAAAAAATVAAEPHGPEAAHGCARASPLKDRAAAGAQQLG